MKRKGLLPSLKGLFNMYRPRYLVEIVYMLQASEYEIFPYLRWYWRTRDVGRVMYRRQLVRTKVAWGLLLVAGILTLMQLTLVSLLLWRSFGGQLSGGYFLALGLFLAYPLITAHAITVPVVLGRIFITLPLTQIGLRRAHKVFSEHPGKVIAIAGSYGKTSMKEILATVLSSGKSVAATAGNMNTHSAHARFSHTLTGKEDVVIVELGEYVPGDIKKYCHVIQPDIGIITGLAPAHLHNFGTVNAAGQNLFDLAVHIGDKHVFVNDENVAMKKFITKNYGLYSRTSVNGWSISRARTGMEGTSFTLSKGKKSLKLKTGLIGKHVLGPVALAVVLAIDEFSLKPERVENAVAKIQPIPHRMQPMKLANGAWLIDDSYNGNIEGVRAIIDFLKEVKAKRKIYVTPGLVEQGIETVAVHNELGEMLADAVDEIFLIRNSTTPLIEAGLANGNFKGMLRKIDDPVKFYESIEYLVSEGDVIVLQNDWTDNYA